MKAKRFGIFTFVIFAFLACCLDEALSKTKHKTPPSSADASPSPGPAPVAVAHLRIWKISENPTMPSPLIRIQSLANPKSAFRSVPLQVGRYDFTGYEETASGATQVEIATPEDASFSKPVRASFFLSPDKANTLIVRQNAGGMVSAEVVDDYAPAVGDLTIYNLLPATYGDAQIVMGEFLTARLAPETGSLRIRGLARRIYAVASTVHNAEGNVLHWNNDIDFRGYRRASLVIWLDSYERVRGRTFPDEPGVTGSAAH